MSRDDKNLCIGCNLCKKVYPVINRLQDNTYQVNYKYSNDREENIHHDEDPYMKIFLKTLIGAILVIF